MLPYDLAEQATLFECDDPVDSEFCGQAAVHGSLRTVIEAAMGWPDCRLAGARVVTANGAEYGGRAIEGIYHEELFDQE